MSRITTRIINGFALVLSLGLTMASLPASAQFAFMPSREAIRP